jgi:hypothetical protein
MNISVVRVSHDDSWANKAGDLSQGSLPVNETRATIEIDSGSDGSQYTSKREGDVPHTSSGYTYSSRLVLFA